MVDGALHRRPRVTMVLRGSARNHPRVLKEAQTLVEAGCRVTIVAAKVPGEDRAVERLGPSLIAVRTTTGLLQALRRVLRRSAESSNSLARSSDSSGPATLRKRRLALMLGSRMLLAVKMARLVVRTRPDAVHAHDFSTLPAAWLATWGRAGSLVYDAHEVNLSREGYYRQLVRLISIVEGCLIRRCDWVITTTELRARHFRRVYGLKSAPTVLQNRPRLAARSAPIDLRADLGIPGHALLCLYQGGLQEGRGLRNVVQAIAEVDGIHGVFIGGGHQEAALRRLVQQSGAAERVHFCGQVPLADVPQITACADVGMQVLRNTCFNHWSTDSNKLFEYALAGIAVIASDFPEIRRVVREHPFGLLVNPHSVEAIAAALKALRDDRALLAAFKRQASASAVALSWDSQAPALLEIYAALGLLRREATEQAPRQRAL